MRAISVRSRVAGAVVAVAAVTGAYVSVASSPVSASGFAQLKYSCTDGSKSIPATTTQEAKTLESLGFTCTKL